MADSHRKTPRRLGAAVKVVLFSAAAAFVGLLAALYLGGARGSLDEQSQVFSLIWLVAITALSLLLGSLAWTRSSVVAQPVVGGLLAGLAVTIDAALALMAFDYGVTRDIAVAMRMLGVAILIVPVGAVIGLGAGFVVAAVASFVGWRASKRAAKAALNEPALGQGRKSRRRILVASLLVAVLVAPLALPVYDELVRRHAVLALRAGGAKVETDRDPRKGWRSWLRAFNDLWKDELHLTWEDEVPLYSLESIFAVVLPESGGDDTDLALAARLPEVKTVHVSGSNITNGGLGHLQVMTSLEHLGLHCQGITDDGLQNISGLTALRILSLVGTTISDEGLQPLSGLTSLLFLDLSETRIEGSGLRHLASLPALHHLELRKTRLTQAGLGELRGLPRLGFLGLSGTEFNEPTFRELSQLTTLISIDLWNTNVIDAWLPHLAALGNARVLIIMRDTQVSDEAARELQKALPNARIVATRKKT